MVKVATGANGSEGEVVSKMLVEDGSSFGQGIRWVDDAGEGFVLNVDEFEGIAGQVGVLSDDDGYGLAYIEDAVGGKDRMEGRMNFVGVGAARVRVGSSVPMPVISSAVATKTTPGSWRARETSMLRMLAWAWGLRRKAAWRRPGILRSSR